MLKLRALILLVLLPPFIFGCATVAEPEWTRFVDDRSGNADVVNVISAKRTDGGLKIAVSLVGKAMLREKIYYNVTWYDKDGFPVDTILGRRGSVSISPKETIDIVFDSPNNDIEDYKLAIND